ncbi:porin family protein [Marinobacter xestospongiae]|uniref:Porin family protein n=1 Tax=Marinobacter xestospongiae TaxID=994319 RepID=A0ABU3VVL7_9GAMM|nr:porin family protein [Marinobacter xestospongiae]MDV2078325.1 porin family protein [Marinobacter xestospongiae]
MKTRTHLMCATILSASVASAPALADKRNDSGLYLGGSYGWFKAHGGEFEDNNDFFAGTLGYQFNDWFAAEAEYLDFSEFGEDDEVNGDLKGLGIAARARLPLTETFGIYGRAGVFAYSLDVDAFEQSETYDELSPFVGAGADFRISDQLTAFAEYNRYNVEIDEEDFNGQVTNDGPDFDTARVGMRFQF